MLVQIGLGLDHIHTDLNITHRELKPANILLFPGNIIKIADFGISKEHDEKTIFVSTKGYASPEIILLEARGKVKPYMQDIYSLGLVACEMMASEFPDRTDVVNKDIKFNEAYTLGIINLVYSMLKTDPAQRPTITELLEHKLLSGEV